ncbi:hypothetical protein D9M71_784580 [compost metagenome]
MQQLAGLAHRLLDFVSLFHRTAERLLHEHVLAGAQSGDADRRMRIVPGADAHGVDVRVREQLAVIRVDLVRSVLIRHLTRSGFVHVADRDDLRVRIARI